MKYSAVPVIFVIAIAALAADPFYLGTWKIDSAVVGPWWNSPGKPDPSESKTLVGKTLTITPTAILGPGILGCKGPKYKVVTIPPEGLFQGAFEEMKRADKSVDVAKLAATLGFTGKTSKSLQTGCANELDFHFVDANTAEFALNEFVYTLKKQ
jgi:hypothetical protein